MPRQKLKLLLKDYSMEEILELNDMEAIDGLELLITYGALDLDEIIEATDGTPED